MELEKENENPEKRYPPLPLEKLNALKSPKDSNDHKPHRHPCKIIAQKQKLSHFQTVKLVLGSHKWRNDSHEPHQRIQMTRMNPTKINCFAIILSRNWLNSGAKPLIFFAKPCKSNLAKAGEGAPNNFVMYKNNGFNYFLWAW